MDYMYIFLLFSSLKLQYRYKRNIKRKVYLHTILIFYLKDKAKNILVIKLVANICFLTQNINCKVYQQNCKAQKPS